MAQPDPADPAFLRKKAAFIAAQQPRFRRVNTTHGAPSDFTLESDDGTVRFNLMAEGVTERMAAYIHELYSTDADRLAGMMFFMAQPCMMRAHTAYDPTATHRLRPLSALRFGSGYCGHMARVMAPVINKMRIGETSEYHKARAFGIGGHAIVIVPYRDDYVLLDSKHCCMFYRLDNTDLATLREIREEPAIARRGYPHWMPALMTFEESFLHAAEPDGGAEGGFSYPAGGPEE